MGYAVLLVDDQPDFLRMARLILATDPAFRVVGTAGTGEEALQRLVELQPDVLLIDVHLPGLNGLETARQALDRWPRVRVVLVSALDDPEYEALSRSVGAAGFLSKKHLEVSRLRQLLGIPR
ncbi:MAG: response regulator transcription factor [Limnochordaceae bacterium]|nr:response regulator transcription factor [Limnochordaceae bacterium]